MSILWCQFFGPPCKFQWSSCGGLRITLCWSAVICGDLRFSWRDMRWFEDYIMLICGDLWLICGDLRLICGDLRFSGRPRHDCYALQCLNCSLFTIVFIKLFYRIIVPIAWVPWTVITFAHWSFFTVLFDSLPQNNKLYMIFQDGFFFLLKVK